jgi:hypothetical protein
LAAILSAVEKALIRRTGRAQEGLTRIVWKIEEAKKKVRFNLNQRVALATGLVFQSTLLNISKSVGRGTRARKRTRTVVTERSKPGEFPRADTTLLMTSLFMGVVKEKRRTWGYIATPQDYGLILEIKLNRSFLVRTLRAQEHTVRRLLTRPIR